MPSFTAKVDTYIIVYRDAEKLNFLQQLFISNGSTFTYDDTLYQNNFVSIASFNSAMANLGQPQVARSPFGQQTIEPPG